MDFSQVSKLWEILEIALDDLKKIEGNDAYVITMNSWHAQHQEKCYVCLAGAVIACRLHPETVLYPLWKSSGQKGRRLLPEDFPDVKGLLPEDFPDVKGKLEALNYLRQGNVNYAYDELNPGKELSTAQVRQLRMFNRKVDEYNSSTRNLFWADMKLLLKNLKAADI